MKRSVFFIILSALLLTDVYATSRRVKNLPLIAAFVYTGELEEGADGSSTLDRMSFFEDNNMRRGHVMQFSIMDSINALQYCNLLDQATKVDSESMPFDVHDCALTCHISANDSLVWTSKVDPVIGAFVVNSIKPDADFESELVLFSRRYIYRGSRRYPMTDEIMSILERLNQQGRRLKNDK